MCVCACEGVCVRVRVCVCMCVCVSYSCVTTMYMYIVSACASYITSSLEQELSPHLTVNENNPNTYK